MTDKYSPTPWKHSIDVNSTILYDFKGRKVVLTEENIKFIVQAVNGYESDKQKIKMLVEACKGLIWVIDKMANRQNFGDEEVMAYNKAGQAITQAKGE